MLGKKLLRAELLIAIYLVLLVLSAALINQLALPESLLLVFGIVAILTAVDYPRKIYLPMLVLLAIAASTVVFLRQSQQIEMNAYISILIAAVTIVITQESLHAIQTRRNQEEELLSKSEQRLRHLLEQSPYGMALSNEQGQLIEWNHAMEQISGQRRSEILGRSFSDIIFTLLPETFKSRAALEKTRATLQEMLKNGRFPGGGRPSEHDLQHADGSIRRVQEILFPIKTDTGYFLGDILIDLLDRHNAEEELKTTNETLRQRVTELQERNKEANLLNEMGDLLQSCLAIEDAYGVVGQFAEKLFPNTPGILYVLNDELNLFEAVARWGDHPLGDTSFAPDDCWTLRRGRMHIVSEPNNRLFCQHLGLQRNGNGFVPYLCVPMTAQGETLGVLNLQARNGYPIEQSEQLASTVAVQIALALANLRLRETLHAQSIRDPLTSLFNRRYMEETFERELHRCARHQLQLGVVMIDIDHFKHFNDTFGHEAGDALLHELGAFLQSSVRSEDVCCRYGGEEFLLILPEANLEDTVRRATQLREGINKLKVQFLGQSMGDITASQGVASFPEHGASVGQLLRSVDAALYRAKRGGRDRISVAEK